MAMHTKVKLESSDHIPFEVNISFVHFSKMVMNVIKVMGGTDITISLPSISSQFLRKVVDYCTFHWQFEKITEGNPVDADTEKDIKKNIIIHDINFLQVDVATLMALIKAAHFLDMEDLLALTCQRTADIITKSTVEEIRANFGIKNDYDPHGQEQMIEE